MRGLLSSAALALIIAGCFKPIEVEDCLRDGTCECISQSDCGAGRDCINGQCETRPIPVPPDEVGKSCAQAADCASGICLPPRLGGGRVCSVVCDSTNGCPHQWQCKPQDAQKLCVPALNTLCMACASAFDCNALGDQCVAGRCARECTFDACPEGYSCAAIAGGARQCVPTAGSCECSDVTAGLQRACSKNNDAGACFGRETCMADGGWSGCDAHLPSAEICNGIDDDCDGEVDQLDPSIDTSALTGYPSCRKGDAGVCAGAWACSDGGWSCSAIDPAAEQCNGRDDDCDGVIDNGFVDGASRYDTPRHCGACGFDCQRALASVADGGVACELRAGAPTCVPRVCAAGFFPFPEAQPISCVPLVGPSCRPCSASSDCSTSFDRCVSVGSDPGTYCAQSCESASPYRCAGSMGQQDCCPRGFVCQASSGTKLCLPAGNSCGCTSSRQGITRSCFVGAAPQSCVGIQTCQADGTWTSCGTATATIELCDSLDNDCDGKVDEDFIGTQGAATYDTDEHCGSCTVNCTAQWSATLQHAIGGCDAGPAVAPSCQIARCTSDSISNGTFCRVDSDCATGQLCEGVFHQCTHACRLDVDCAGGNCFNGRCAVPCSAGSPCQAPASCGDAGVCVRDYRFVNSDRDSTNGCECAVSGAVDVPETYGSYPDAGLPYIDVDCDGIDGVESESLFVSSLSTQSLGTRQHPFRTIREAVTAFNPAAHSAILVAAGTYVEQVVLRDGVKIFGGYSNDFSRRDVAAFSTLIEGPEPAFDDASALPGTIHAANISSPTAIAGFTVRGYDVTYRAPAASAGKNSYAIYVKSSSSALRIVNNRVVGGRGGDGTTGEPGAAGVSGDSGGNGVDSRECSSTTCTGEFQDGGAAGKNLACASSNGSRGASSTPLRNPQEYQSPLGLNGLGGSNNQYGGTSDAGACKPVCFILGESNARPALNGTDGIALAAGQGCSAIGTMVQDEWVAGVALDGTSGTHGIGGGGGGAGGCASNTTTATCTVGNRVGDLGATGGGGGAGGCGGLAGKHGGSGGASFGIFVVGTGGLPTVEGNLIEVGAGGAGGNGGPGGYGGVGGQGGEAGIRQWPSWCAGSGGRGGRGGTGGAGTGGGGGCGGMAFGLAGVGISPATYDVKNRFGAVAPNAAGVPGAGGASPAGPSKAGTSGSTGLAGGYREL